MRSTRPSSGLRPDRLMFSYSLVRPQDGVAPLVSTAKWRFSLLLGTGARDDTVKALCDAGFGEVAAETVWNALLESGELGLAVRKDSGVDPRVFVQKLTSVGVRVEWRNEPAA